MFFSESHDEYSQMWELNMNRVYCLFIINWKNRVVSYVENGKNTIQIDRLLSFCFTLIIRLQQSVRLLWNALNAFAQKKNTRGFSSPGH